MPADITALSLYRFRRYAALTRNGVRYPFEAGMVVKASSTCDPEGGTANMAHDPPLVRVHVLERFAHLLDLVQGAPDSAPAPPPTSTPSSPSD